MQVTGHAAIVTGAASGLGAATARALAAAGARVALLDLNETAAAAIAAAIGGRAFACDVTDAQSAAAAVAAARGAHGPARILLNSAGIAPAARIIGRHRPLPPPPFP